MADTKKKAAEEPRWYRVVAPYVLLRQPSPGGFSIAGLHQGATVDATAVPDYQLRHHVNEGMIEPIQAMQGEVAQADPALWARPAADAPHQTWVEYATGAGLDGPAMAGKSRDELAALFGVTASDDDPGPMAVAAASGSTSGPEPDLAMPDRPDDGDSKPAWVEYAVAKGALRDEAQHSTRAELITKYGGS